MNTTIRISVEAHAELVRRARVEGRTIRVVVDRLVGVGAMGDGAGVAAQVTRGRGSSVLTAGVGAAERSDRAVPTPTVEERVSEMNAVTRDIIAGQNHLVSAPKVEPAEGRCKNPSCGHLEAQHSLRGCFGTCACRRFRP